MAAGLPPDSSYVTGVVPPEMREGLEGPEIAPPTGITDIDGQPAHLTRVRIPRPAHIPVAPRPVQGDTSGPLPQASGAPAPQFLQYDFPLLPGVQCRVTFQGELKAEHLEQLRDYLEVACKRLREQRVRSKVEPAPPKKGKLKQGIEKDNRDGN